MDKGIGEKQRKTFHLEIKSIHQDDEFFFFEGYLSTFNNEDRGGDIVLKGAFIESLKKHIPSLLWSHSPDEPLGIFEDIFEDDIGLFVKAKMPLADDFVMKRIIPQMKIGSIRSMSIGFSIWNKDNDPGSTMDSNGIRLLKRMFLWDGSLVTIPMNELAIIKGLQNNVSIHENDILDSIEIIKKYYKNMGIDSPFNEIKSFNTKDFDSLDEKTFEKFFHKGVKFSRKSSKTLVSFIKAGLAGDGDDSKRDVVNDDWYNVIQSIKTLNRDMENKNGW